MAVFTIPPAFYAVDGMSYEEGTYKTNSTSLAPVDCLDIMDIITRRAGFYRLNINRILSADLIDVLD